MNDKEKIKKTLELIQDFEDSGSSKHYKANAQKMRIMLDAIKKILEAYETEQQTKKIYR
jgi:hypothetical protein